MFNHENILKLLSNKTESHTYDDLKQYLSNSILCNSIVNSILRSIRLYDTLFGKTPKYVYTMVRRKNINVLPINASYDLFLRLKLMKLP